MESDQLAHAPQTMVDLLIRRAERYVNKTVFAYASNGKEEEVQLLTYRELDLRARAIAVSLQRRGAADKHVLTLCPSGLDLITAIFGCFYAGAIAVPVHPPVHSRLVARVAAIVADSQAQLVLTTEATRSELKEVVDGLPEGKSLRWITVEDALEEDAADWSAPDISSTDTAFLQYTSGSTGTPKGVVLTNRNLLANLESINRTLGKGDQARVVSWLPLHHDMGLIGGVFGIVYAGATCFLMPPSAFIERPMRWLETISKYRANLSVGPNFSYDLCVERSTPEERAALDLSTWVGTYTGAEPVRVATMERFAAAFAPAGFRPEAFRPVYGLAEATLLVTGREQYDSGPAVRYVDAVDLRENRVTVVSPQHPSATAVVGCGRAGHGQRVVIADPVTRRQCPPGEVGEIWVAGENVAAGYWRKPKETEETFNAHLSDTGDGPFLRTGDLGFVLDDELFVSGRLKDLVIIRGRNYYPNDIEYTVQETHPGLMSGRGAVFSVASDTGEAEQLIVVQEVDRERVSEDDFDDIIGAIRTAVTAEHEIRAHAILLTDPLRIPTTSSGKIRRSACRQKYLEGTLETLAEWHAPTRAEEPIPTPRKETTGGTSRSAAEIADWIRTRLATELGLPPSEIDNSQPLAYYGLDSVRAIQLMSALEAWLGRKTTPTLAYDYPTIELLAAHLAGDDAEHTRAAAESASRSTDPDEPIAIIGIGCRFPGAEGPSAFWRLLSDGVNATTEVPPDRWNADVWADAAGRWGGFLDQVDRFDAEFFGISPREAARMDPQQRLLMEVTWEALEDGAQVASTLAGSRTGVFIGISTAEYQHLALSNPGLIDAYSGTGTSASIAANRLSYFYDFRGPSMAVDTACSSSLVAVHLACRSLRDGECTLALAGGVNVILSPAGSVNFTKAGVLAGDGLCKPFDAAADGWVRGEGAGVVVLKPLSQALADGDSIYAVIRGTAVNQDGRTNGLMAPSRSAQEDVLAQAYRRAGISPGVVQYVETQGLGTLLGDTVEAQALGSTLGKDRAADSICQVGSVKANIGHLEAAAGIAGLIKVALSLRNRMIPPTLNFSEPNPNIPFETMSLRVARRLMPWPDGGRAIAGVSAFGFGGTNAHVVLAEAPQVRVAEPASPAAGERKHILPLSARSAEALVALAGRYEEALASGAPLAGLCSTAATRRSHHDYRLAVAGESGDEVREALAAYRQGRPHPGLSTGRRDPGLQPGAVFIFSGEGSQWRGMGHWLHDHEPAFRDALAMCDHALQPYLKTSLLDEILAPAEQYRLDDDADIIAPAIFAIQVALAALWRSWGVAPSAVIGHSLGEVAAAHVAGALNIEDAARLVCARTHLTRRTSERAARRDLMQELANLHRTAATVPIYSTVTGTAVDGELFDSAHWIANLSAPVALSTAVRNLVEAGCRTFVEIGPDNTLQHAFDDADEGSRRTALLASMRSDEQEHATMFASLGALYCSGVPVDWERLQPGDGPPTTAPTYPWQRKRFWLGDNDEGPSPLAARNGADGRAPAEAQDDVSLHVTLGQADRQERKKLLESYLREQAAGKLGMTPSLLDIESPLNTLGVDSLMAAELRAQIERDLGIAVPVAQLLDGPSIARLADWLGGALSESRPWQPDPVVPRELVVTAPDGRQGSSGLAGSQWIDLLSQVPEVSDNDVDALLREVLSTGGRQDG